MTTIFVVLIVAMAATTFVALRPDEESSNQELGEILQENQQLKRELETLRQLHSQLLEDKAFLQFMRADQDHQRQLLALDLHDMSLPNLTSALFQLEALNQRLDSMEGSMDATIELLRDCLHQTRRVMNGLSPSLVQDEGVIASVQRLVEQSQASVDGIRFEHDVEFDRLSPLCECALVQLVREALDQLRRNRFAQNVEVELIQKDDRLHLTISDDGHGELADTPRMLECLEILSGQPTVRHELTAGQVMQVEFSVTDLIQSDTIKEKSQAFS